MNYPKIFHIPSFLGLLSLLLYLVVSFLPQNNAFVITPAPLSSLTMARRATTKTLMRQSKDSSIVEPSDAVEAEVVSGKKRVAIIGGGIAGLTCAQFLSNSGRFDVTVFDTGRIRPGGRCSSRRPGDRPKEGVDKEYPILSKHIIDHSVQILKDHGVEEYFTEFQKQIEQWEDDGVIVPYPDGTVCNIVKKKEKRVGFDLRPLNTLDKPYTMFYGANGMASIPEAIRKSGSFDLRQDVWVSPNNGVWHDWSELPIPWTVQANRENFGRFHHLIIAHNGKCADRLMKKTPAKELHSLLRVNFAPSVAKWGGTKMTLNSLYSLSFALPKDESVLAKVLPADKFITGFIKNESQLACISCHSRKYEDDDDPSNEEIWTVLSSPYFAKKYKAPQEFLPDDVVHNVTKLLFEAVERSLDLLPGSLSEQVLESRLQLWGAALPLNVWESSSVSVTDNMDGYIYDLKHDVGVCGDWLVEPSIAGAWESGRRLARHLNVDDEEEIFTCGLPEDGSFFASSRTINSGIGAVR